MRERLNALRAIQGSTFYGSNVSAEPATIFSLISNKQKKANLLFSWRRLQRRVAGELLAITTH
jgi:hypothetical protein